MRNFSLFLPFPILSFPSHPSPILPCPTQQAMGERCMEKGYYACPVTKIYRRNERKTRIVDFQLSTRLNIFNNWRGSPPVISASFVWPYCLQRPRPFRGSGVRQRTEKNLMGRGLAQTTHPLKRRLVDIHQTAEYLNLPVNTVYKFVSQRRIPYIKVGRLLRFDIALLDDWITKQTVMPMHSRPGYEKGVTREEEHPHGVAIKTLKCGA